MIGTIWTDFSRYSPFFTNSPRYFIFISKDVTIDFHGTGKISTEECCEGMDFSPWRQL